MIGQTLAHFEITAKLGEGEDSKEVIGRGPLSVDKAVPIALRIAEALEAAHGKGIIHRDLKPGNIKILSDGSVRVLDLGLAQGSTPGDSRARSPANRPRSASGDRSSPVPGLQRRAGERT